MKRNFYKFLLFVYTEHIQEDWDDYNKLGKIVIKPAWFVRAVLVWIISPIFFFEWKFKQSKHYKAYKKFGSALTMEQMKMLNQLNTRNFLNMRYGRSPKHITR